LVVDDCGDMDVEVLDEPSEFAFDDEDDADK
jgi:hypothetical protein